MRYFKRLTDTYIPIKGDLRKASGIYKIASKIDSRVYIGSSVNIDKRYAGHCRKLSYGTHHNAHLQAFVNKYGPQNLEFSIVELCDKLSLQEREQFHIDAFDAYKQGFNTAPTATNTTGYKFTEEQRKNVSNGLKNSEKMRRARLVTQPYQTKILQEWCKNHQAELRTHMLTVIKEYRSKPVRCLNDGKIYESAREAARVLGLPHSSVPKVTNGIMSQTHGYRFEYVKSKTEDAELMAQ